jgi:hypothetical protein
MPDSRGTSAGNPETGMRNLLIGIAILAAGAWAVLALEGPRSSSGRGLSGAFSGYSKSPTPAVQATKGVAESILKN